MSDRWDYSGGYDGPHPDRGTHADESVADTPEVERYDPQLDPDRNDHEAHKSDDPTDTSNVMVWLGFRKGRDTA